MVNSVLDSLPTYMVSLFPMPVKIEKKIDALRRKFIWQGNEEKGISFSQMENSDNKQEGEGLGIRNLRHHNKSLMLKWLWRFSLKYQAFWRKVIVDKYGLEGSGPPAMLLFLIV